MRVNRFILFYVHVLYTGAYFKAPYHSHVGVEFLTPYSVGCRITEEFVCHTPKLVLFLSKETDLSSIHDHLARNPKSDRQQTWISKRYCTLLQLKYAPDYTCGLCFTHQYSQHNKNIGITL